MSAFKVSLLKLVLSLLEIPKIDIFSIMHMIASMTAAAVDIVETVVVVAVGVVVVVVIVIVVVVIVIAVLIVVM